MTTNTKVKRLNYNNTQQICILYMYKGAIILTKKINILSTSNHSKYFSDCVWKTRRRMSIACEDPLTTFNTSSFWGFVTFKTAHMPH